MNDTVCDRLGVAIFKGAVQSDGGDGDDNDAFLLIVGSIISPSQSALACVLLDA